MTDWPSALVKTDSLKTGFPDAIIFPLLSFDKQLSEFVGFKQFFQALNGPFFGSKPPF
jgi:hypothetical protein